MIALVVPGSAELLLFWGLVATLVVVPAWRICARLGLPPIASLAALIPGVNLVLLWILAFTRWPAVDGPGERHAISSTPR